MSRKPIAPRARNIQRRMLCIVGCLLLLSACKRGWMDTPASTPSPSAPGTPTAPPATAQAASPAMIRVEPAEVPCEPLSVVKVSWDVGTLVPSGGETVEIWTGTGTDDPKAKLFSRMGGAGSATTGAWARPGVTFRAIRISDGHELGRVSVGGPANCPPHRRQATSPMA